MPASQAFVSERREGYHDRQAVRNPTQSARSSITGADRHQADPLGAALGIASICNVVLSVAA